MLAIEIEFLMGRSIATDVTRRDKAEWPPHPQRLFSALVATHAELDMGEQGEAALKWLENLPPPEIRVDEEPACRLPVSHFVPVNDDAMKVEKKKADFRHVLDRRDRRERFFPATVPRDPVVTFQWRDAVGLEQHRDALGRIVEELTYLGHSASPIRGCLRDKATEPTLVPCDDDDADYSLRVPGRGRLDRLMQVHELRLEEEGVQPPLGRMQAYATRSDVPETAFSRDGLVLAFESGPKLSLDSTLPLMQHLRDAVLARIGNAAPEVLTGHDHEGNASSANHLAYVPMAFVGGAHADGSLKGAALIPPREIDASARRRLRAALLGSWALHLGPLGSIGVRLVEPGESTLFSLRFGMYAKASDTWASVTPVFLDRHPKKGKLTPEQIIAESCIRIGLPRPAEIRLGPVSALSGAPRVMEFHGRSKQTDGRIRQHALIRFERKVAGPILLGAGRFIGLGVFLPIRKAVLP